MHIARPTLVLAASATALLLLAGCSSPAPSSPSDPSAPAVSPLDVYLNVIYGVSGTPDERDASESAEQAEIEARTASCMAAEGFSYTPETRPYREMAGGGVEWKPNDRDWVAQWGYGVVDHPGDTAAQTGATDANEAYLQTLSSSERAAWERALWGYEPDAEETTSDRRATIGGGCWERALEEFSGSVAMDQFAALLDAVGEFEEQEARWPGQEQLDAEWSACMTERGRPDVSSPGEAVDQFVTQLSDLAKKNRSAGTGGSATRSPESTRSPETDALKKTEVETALADLDCRQKIDYDARADEIRWNAEERFVADHKAELDAAKAAAEQSRARS